MRYIFVLLISALLGTSVAAQEPGKKLQETARSMLQQGDLDNAIAILETAIKQAPGNLEIAKDLAYACYLKRDFSKAIEVGRSITERSDADEQSFQILGLAYKGTALYKEASKMYRTALKKFPNSAVIYNEYGEALAMDNDLNEAIKQWEKGIQADGNYSGNYYNACIYYTKAANWVRVMLYGELFVNLESYSARTAEVKKALVNAWQKLWVPTVAAQLQKAGNNTAFEKSILDIIIKTQADNKTGFDAATSTAIRTRFVLDWFTGKAASFPFRLFDHQQYLIREGLFEAYNQWLFGEAVNEDMYAAWQKNHEKEAAAWKTFQAGRVFKVPTGQYYF